MVRSGTAFTVCLEVGVKRVFATALDWPGWSRSGRDEGAALEALVRYGSRYAAVMTDAGLSFRPPARSSELEVVERVGGDATTDFGAPGVAPDVDATSLSLRQLTPLRTMLEACWAAFDRAAEAARGVELRTGPRGGGRELDAILEHVMGAEGGYLGRLAAPRPKTEGVEARRALAAMHSAAAEGLRHAVSEGMPGAGPRGGALWTPRYFVRRAAWHVLDHTWELEDRATPA